MTKSKIPALILILVMIVLVPACKSTRKKVDPVQQPVVEQQPPIVQPPPAASETVTAPADFVKSDPEPTEDFLPADMDELNRVARDRGWIRDAFFTYDEATLDSDAQSALTSSATWLKGPQGATYGVLLEGHCDERGTEQYNLALGDRRANAAKDYLVTLGVDARRIRTVSYGEERPFDDGHNDSAWRQNRRAHIVLVR